MSGHSLRSENKDQKIDRDQIVAGMLGTKARLEWRPSGEVKVQFEGWYLSVPQYQPQPRAHRASEKRQDRIEIMARLQQTCALSAHHGTTVNLISYCGRYSASRYALACSSVFTAATSSPFTSRSWAVACGLCAAIQPMFGFERRSMNLRGRLQTIEIE